MSFGSGSDSVSDRIKLKLVSGKTEKKTHIKWQNKRQGCAKCCRVTTLTLNFSTSSSYSASAMNREALGVIGWMRRETKRDKETKLRTGETTTDHQREAISPTQVSREEIEWRPSARRRHH